VDATIELADSPEEAFLPFLPYYRTPFDKAAFVQKLKALGWKE
jgi:hypothetical protein